VEPEMLVILPVRIADAFKQQEAVQSNKYPHLRIENASNRSRVGSSLFRLPDDAPSHCHAMLLLAASLLPFVP